MHPLLRRFTGRSMSLTFKKESICKQNEIFQGVKKKIAVATTYYANTKFRYVFFKLNIKTTIHRSILIISYASIEQFFIQKLNFYLVTMVTKWIDIIDMRIFEIQVDMKQRPGVFRREKRVLFQFDWTNVKWQWERWKMEKFCEIVNVDLNEYLLFRSMRRRDVDAADIFHSVNFEKIIF